MLVCFINCQSMRDCCCGSSYYCLYSTLIIKTALQLHVYRMTYGLAVWTRTKQNRTGSKLTRWPIKFHTLTDNKIITHTSWDKNRITINTATSPLPPQLYYFSGVSQPVKGLVTGRFSWGYSVDGSFDSGSEFSGSSGETFKCWQFCLTTPVGMSTT